MKALFRTVIILVLIPVIILGVLFGLLAYKLSAPTPMDYPYLHSTDEIESIEFAEISFEGGVINADGIGFIKDHETFLNDLNNLPRNSKPVLEIINNMANTKELEGIIINYKDGSFEIITAYVNLKSAGVASGDFKIGFYTFDNDAFGEMLDEYKSFYVKL